MGDEKNTLKHIHFNAHLHICFVSLLYTSLGALIGLNLAGQLWLGERKQQQYQLAELSRAIRAGRRMSEAQFVAVAIFAGCRIEPKSLGG